MVSGRDAQNPEDAKAFVIWESGGALTPEKVEKMTNGFKVFVSSLDGHRPRVLPASVTLEEITDREYFESLRQAPSGWCPYSNPQKPAGQE
jgi:hypothetical protein